MKIKDIMSPHARCIEPSAALPEAAALMRELDVGAVPVCDNDRLAGIITDRDIVIRAVAENRDVGRTTVGEVMTPEIIYVFEDQDVEEAARLMEVRQIRRLAVLNRDKRLVGMVALGDLAVDASAGLSGEALKEISRPVHHATG